MNQLIRHLFLLIGVFSFLFSAAQLNQWPSTLSPSDPVVQQALAAAPRDVNICGTGVGETPFTIDAQLLSNYNGFGVSCKDTCDGIVEVSVTGGIGPFTFQWVGGPNTALWNAACGGIEIVIVTDAGQGIQCATQVQVSEPANLSVIFVGAGIVQPSCSGVCDGSATVFAVGGAGGPYIYDWNNGASMSNSVNDLCEGVNVLHIEDQNGCFLDTVFVLSADPIVPDAMSQDLSCNGVCDGTIWLGVTGGQPGYSYVWSPVPPIGAGTDSISGLCAGTWSVTITDANSCDTTISIDLTQPTPIIPGEVITDALCWNTCDGEVLVNPTGAVGPFTYDWTPDPANGDGSNIATGLCPGPVTVLITDQATACDTLVTITVGSPPVLDPQLATVDASCKGFCDGEASVTPVGGTASYTFLWVPTPPIGQGTANVSGLCAGSYTLTISDAQNCDTIVTFDILEPDLLDPVPSFTDISCNGACDGSASVAPIGGTGTYSYSWVPAPPVGQGTPDASDLCAGIWTVLVSDVNGCDTLVEFTITEPDELLGTLSVTDASCIGDCDGSASVVLTGGTMPYTYVWAPAPASGQGSDQADGFCVGAYTLTVTDFRGCELILPFSIGEPSPFNVVLNFSDPSCGSSCDGTADVTVSGSNGNGPGDYTYFWNPAPGAGQGTPAVTGICLGFYEVTITDLLGCDTTLSFTLTNPPLLLPNETVSDQSCFNTCDGSIVLNPTGGIGGVTVVWSPIPPNGQGVLTATGLCAGTWVATISDATGCDTTLTMTVDAPPGITLTTNQTDASCGGLCDGTADIYAVGNGPFIFTWSPVPTSVTDTDSTTVATGLCAIIYDVTVSDANGCDSIFQFTIVEPDPISNQATIGDVSCIGDCDGTIDVVSIGGSGALVYSWSPVPPVGAGTANISSLCAGVYTLTVTDDNTCQHVEAFTVGQPSLMNVSIAVTDPSCGIYCDGSAVATVSGGNGPDIYFWDPAPATGQGSDAVTGLCLGNYTLTVTDSLGCDTTIAFSITSPPLILANPTVQDASCFGVCDGEIVLNPVGGVGALTVLWNPVPPGGPNVTTASGLCPGQWSATISDPTGCDTTFTWTINDPAPMILSSIVQHPDCAGECNGSIDITATGIGPFTFVWSPVPPIGAGTGSVSDLCPGPWSVVISDGNSCDSTVLFTINDPAQLNATLSTSPSGCGGACIGTASVIATGGSGPLTYNWGPGVIVGQGTPNVTDLCSGAYSLVVTDSLGCDTTISFTISSPSGIMATPSVSDATCNNVCNGTITLGMAGGLPPYTYVWTPTPPLGDGTPSVAGLCPGIYTVVISDDAQCDTVLTIPVGSSTVIDPVLSSSDISCFGTCDGSISFQPNGGLPGYNYNWSPVPPAGQGVSSANNLCADVYTVVISDANGCDTTVVVTIIEPQLLVVDLSTTEAHCAICDGTASIDITGGTGPITIEWLDQTATVIGVTDTLFGLCAGPYQVTVTDFNGCDTVINFLLEDADGETLSTTAQSPSCSNNCDGEATVSFTCSDPPCVINWLNSAGVPIGQNGTTATALCVDLYYVVVTNASGCLAADSVNITAPVVYNVTVNAQDVDCAGACTGSIDLTVIGADPITYVWTPTPPLGDGTNSVGGLCAGPWSVTMTDANGCDSTMSFLISQPDPILASLATTPSSCGGLCDGTASVLASGGTGTLTYTWAPGVIIGQGTPNATDLCAGLYTLTVSDANGCDTLINFSVNTPSGIVAVPTVSDATCNNLCDGQISLAVSGGQVPYTFLWSPTPIAGQGTSTVTGLCPGQYMVVVSDDALCDTILIIDVASSTTIDPGETVTNINCGGQCTGVIVFNPSGGSPGYTYFWNPVPPSGQGVSSATGLCAGQYDVTLSDANGCDTTVSINIVQPLPFDVTLNTTLAHCLVCDGTASVDILGGTFPYQYTWFDAASTQIGTTDSIFALCAGNYSLLIQDGANCDTTIFFLLADEDGEALTSSFIPPTCSSTCDGEATVSFVCSDPPCVIDWLNMNSISIAQNTSTATGLCAETYYVVVTNGSGCISVDTVNIISPSVITPSILLSGINCQGQCDGSAVLTVMGGVAPYQYVWNPAPPVGQGTPVAQGLCAGSYTVNIMDDQGCDTTLSFDILEPGPLVVLPTIDAQICFGTCDGQIILNSSGGIGPYSYVWSPVPPNGQGVNFATGLCPGVYNIVVFDANNCSQSLNLSVPGAAPFNVTSTTTPSSCGLCIGTGTVSATGAGGGYSFVWVDSDGTQVANTASASALCADVYQVTITDQDGCDTTVVVTISDLDGEQLTTSFVAPACATSCDAIGIVSFVCSDPPCLIDWMDGAGNSLGVSNDSLFNACPGSYLVSVSNNAGCVTIETLTIVPPAGVIPSIVSTPISCTGVCDASATVTHTGGVPTFTYIWSPAPAAGQGTPTASGLCSGVYTVTVSDGNACDTVISVTILEPTMVAASAVVTNNNCAGECNAEITITPSGGTAPYFYLWSPIPPNGQGGNVAAGLCAGVYQVSVFDSHNCDTTLIINVVDPPSIAATVSSVSSSCGNCDGSVAASATGGTGTLSYTWTDQSNNPVGTGPSIANLCAGLYTVLVSDGAGCDTSLTVAVSDIDGEVLSTSTTPPTCANSCDGSVSVSYVCVNAPCTVEWYDSMGTPIGQTTDIATGLCAGQYFVTLTNSLGCVTIDTVQVTLPFFATVQYTTTGISCFGSCDGTATVTTIGGAGPMTYFWSPAPGSGQNTDQVTGLCVGSYSVLITDANNCDTTISILIIGPDELIASAIVNEPSCNGDCDGSILVVPSGGTVPYTYTWSPVPPNGQGNNTATQLCQGTYSVLVQDANGCDTTLNFTLNEPPAIVISLTSTANITCFGDCVGVADALISGGVQPYTTTWTNGSGNVIATDTLNVSQLCAGTYLFSVLDASGCSADTSFTITQGAPIDAGLLFTNEGCNVPCDAYATVAPSGGDGGPYLVTWNPTPPFIGTDSVAGLCAGPWEVTIQDNSGCDTTIMFVVNTAIPISATSSAVNVSCNGACDGTISLNVSGGAGVYDFVWTPTPPTGQGTDSISDLCPGVYNVLISDSLGCDTALSFTITEPDTLVVVLDQVTSPTCASVNDGLIAVSMQGGSPPFVYQWTGPNAFIAFTSTITQLYVGQYDLLVLDDANCQVTYSITLFPVIEVIASAGADTAMCLTDSLLLLDGSTSIGATTYSWEDLNATPLGNDDSLYVSLATVGTVGYVLTVSDGGQCIDSDTVMVSTWALPFADAGPDQVIYDPDDPVFLGGNPTSPLGSSVVWLPDSLLDNPNANDPIFTPGESTWFVVYVTDTNGCVGLDSAYIEIFPEFGVPTGFSPNSDGTNDVWELDLTLLFPDIEVEIYSRWGELLYRNEGYTIPWDGQYDGQPLPVGTYYYVIELNDSNFPEPLTGPVTLIR